MLFFGNASEVLTPGAVQLLLVLGLLWGGARMWQNRAGRKLRIIIGMVFVWAWVFSTPGIANLALIQLEGRPADYPIDRTGPATYVVMGAGTPAGASVRHGAQLSLAGWRRVQAAVEQWRKTGGELLFVGGLAHATAPETTSLAATMRSLALQWGVPDGSIKVAGHNSHNSRDDLMAAQAVLNASPAQYAYLVTSAAHMPRSIAVAKRLGLTLAPMPTDWRQLSNPGWRSWFPNNGGPALWQRSIYELLGIIAYQSRGWL